MFGRSFVILPSPLLGACRLYCCKIHVMRMKLKNSRLFRIVLLLGWIFGILAPLYSVSRGSETIRIAFDRVFQTQASHVIMHMFLYAVMAALIVSLLSGTRLPTVKLLYFTLAGTAAVAIFQEAVQMLSESLTFGSDEVLDVFIDLTGGLLGVMLYLRLRRTVRVSESSR